MNKQKQDTQERQPKGWSRLGSNGNHPSFLGYLKSHGCSRDIEPSLESKKKKVKGPQEKSNQGMYYRYNKDRDHNTNECLKLKMAIRKVIEKGHSIEFITNSNQPQLDNRPLE